ncbi:transmembrane protein 17-like [Anoplophora glabripennis]|uniref:transmembrane protein 17-like n=1 Tax=Anoplophora glabripennis TaxID=217634 RepID=UPI000873FBB4|nr:transmembrane protein 17-like [Anoplophora glabripennis]
MDWRETVTSVSDHVFPGLSHKIDNKLTGNEVLSNLPLQMSLYFNVVFAPVWILVIIIFLTENFYLYSELNKFIIVTIVTTIFLVEILRLFLGYEGNLRDRIPELAGFWMLSLLLQFPLQGFLLLNPYFGFYVLEVVAQTVMFCMLCVQLISGYCALKYTASKQATYFRIMKLRTDISLADIENRYRMN